MGAHTDYYFLAERVPEPGPRPLVHEAHTEFYFSRLTGVRACILEDKEKCGAAGAATRKTVGAEGAARKKYGAAGAAKEKKWWRQGHYKIRHVTLSTLWEET